MRGDGGIYLRYQRCPSHPESRPRFWRSAELGMVGPGLGPRADGAEARTVGPGKCTVLVPLLEAYVLLAAWILTAQEESSDPGDEPLNSDEGMRQIGLEFITAGGAHSVSLLSLEMSYIGHDRHSED